MPGPAAPPSIPGNHSARALRSSDTSGPGVSKGVVSKLVQMPEMSGCPSGVLGGV